MVYIRRATETIEYQCPDFFFLIKIKPLFLDVSIQTNQELCLPECFCYLSQTQNSIQLKTVIHFHISNFLSFTSHLLFSLFHALLSLLLASKDHQMILGILGYHHNGFGFVFDLESSTRNSFPVHKNMQDGRKNPTSFLRWK